MKRAGAKLARSEEARMVHIRLRPDLHRRLRMVVAAEDTSFQEWMARMVEQAISERWPAITERNV